MVFDPDHILKTIESQDNGPVDLASAALALAAMQLPGLSVQRYQRHLESLPEAVRVRFAALLDGGAEDDVYTRLAALKDVVALENGYTGEGAQPDNIDNANLIHVIERRKGLPAALAVLYIHCGRTLGWMVEGLNMPGHFVCRIECAGVREIFDPADAARILGAPDLRAFVKRARGPGAELSSDFYETISDREFLIRLQNNIKFRQIEMEDYEGALLSVQLMQRVDPGEFRLLLDAGVLYARTGRKDSAIDALEAYIKQAPQDRDRHEAALLLQDLKSIP